MALFWLISVSMILLALALVVPPLLGAARRRAPRRPEVNAAIHRERLAELEQERAEGRLSAAEYEQERAELEHAALEDVEGGAGHAPAARRSGPVVAVAVAVAIPTLGFGLYLQLGAPQSFLGGGAAAPAAAGAPSPGGAAGGGAGAEAPAPHPIEQMVTRLEQRLQQSPNDPEGWLMLARSYAALDRLEEARDAYREARRQAGDEPLVLTGLAQVLARMNDGRLAGEPEQLAQRALEVSPDFEQALWLVGVAALQRGDNERAIRLWKRLHALGTLDAEQQRTLEDFIARAGGSVPATPAAPPAPAAAGAATAGGSAPAKAAGASLTVHVTLAPRVASEAQPGDTVFVFARAVEGPPMPLAIVRRQVKDLPLRVTLDDSMAMMPALRLSGFDRVTVGARVSRSGNATPQSGDLQGFSEPVDPASGSTVEVSISDEVP